MSSEIRPIGRAIQVRPHGYCVVILLAWLVTPALGQTFLTPIDHFNGEAVLRTQDGREIEGQVSPFTTKSTRGIMKFTFEDLEGNRQKFKAAEVATLRVKLDGLAKLALAAKQTESIVGLIKGLKNRFEDTIEREYVYYEGVELPKHPGKYRLCQLLNPGFDSKIKVYYGGREKEGLNVGGGSGDMIQITEDRPSVLLASKNGARPVLISKMRYNKKRFDELFGDCEEMQKFSKKERKFKYFAHHVFVYDQACD
jgi:hypothetical protein